MRPLERAYLRCLLDPEFASALQEDNDTAKGLEPAERALLAGLAGKTLEVERRGRWRHLWLRVHAQLPRTSRRANAQLSSQTMQALRRTLFCDTLWHPERTIDLPVVGQGYELATHVRDALGLMLDAAREPELELLWTLAQLERSRIDALLTGGMPAETAASVSSQYDLARAVAELETSADALRISESEVWEISFAGEIRSQKGPAATR